MRCYKNMLSETAKHHTHNSHLAQEKVPNFLPPEKRDGKGEQQPWSLHRNSVKKGRIMPELWSTEIQKTYTHTGNVRRDLQTKPLFRLRTEAVFWHSLGNTFNPSREFTIAMSSNDLFLFWIMSILYYPSQ